MPTIGYPGQDSSHTLARATVTLWRARKACAPIAPHLLEHVIVPDFSIELANPAGLVPGACTLHTGGRYMHPVLARPLLLILFALLHGSMSHRYVRPSKTGLDCPSPRSSIMLTGIFASYRYSYPLVFPQTRCSAPSRTGASAYPSLMAA